MTSRAEHTFHLQTLSTELSDAYIRFGLLVAKKDQDRAAVLQQEIVSNSTSVSGADRMVEIHTVDLTVEIAKSHWQIKSLEERCNNLRFILKHGLDSFV